MHKIYAVRLIYVLSGLVVAGFLAYTVLWFFVRNQVDHQIRVAWENAQTEGWVIQGNQPQVTGFPGIPQLLFSGKIILPDGTVWDIPSLEILGFALPGQALYAEAKDGLTIQGASIPMGQITLQAAALRLRIPEHLPEVLDEPHLRDWKNSGGKINVEWLSFSKGAVLAEGGGGFELDNALQPSGQIAVKVYGVGDLLADMAERKVISGKDARVAMSIANVLTQTDAKTGKSYIVTDVRIQNGGVFLGPMRVATLPTLAWSPTSSSLPLSSSPAPAASLVPAKPALDAPH